MVALPISNSPTLDKIYAAYEAAAERDERTYLGASAMGNECDRALWYQFRWAAEPEQFDGRKLRLFEAGHREEARMVADLIKAGVTVQELDPETGRQWGVVALNGHFRGHMDGQAWGFAEAPVVPHLIEMKTHNEKSFKDLVAKGVALSKPAHMIQMQIYMHLAWLTRAFYMAHNKNTDELYTERVAYDPVQSAQIMARAERIINSAEPPPKLHENPQSKMAFVCGWCPSFGICHGGQSATRRNCRTCLSSTPVEGGFSCDRFKQINDPELQRKGCSMHLFIPSLIQGSQEDVSEDGHQVTYKMRDGSTWIDGVAV
jgi:hypothetical protein